MLSLLWKTTMGISQVPQTCCLSLLRRHYAVQADSLRLACPRDEKAYTRKT